MFDTWREATFVVLDFETSGLSDDVVEVGAVRWRPWRSGATWQRLCRPLLPIPPAATSVHGITNEMVEAELHFVRVLPELIRFVGDAVLVAHNAPFDRAVLEAALARVPSAPLENPFVDTLRLSRHFFPDAPAHDLATLCWFHRIRRERAHRALDDALATAEVLRIVLECVAQEGRERFEELLEIGTWQKGERRAAPSVMIEREEQALLEGALARGDRVEITTRSEKGLERRRVIVPYVIDRARGVPRLVAYDVDRGETKVFRLDRVVSVGNTIE